MVAEREAKSISVEDTYDTDLVDRRLLEGLLERQARKVAERLREARLSGRTVTVKVRLHDFTTHTRSSTLRGADRRRRACWCAAPARLLGEVDTSDGVRLLGVGVSGLADWIQEELFDDWSLEADADAGHERASPDLAEELVAQRSPATSAGGTPAMDVVHAEHGPGWVWGSGVGRVTVRFETAETGPGPVRTFARTTPRCTGGSCRARSRSPTSRRRNLTSSPGRSWAQRSRSAASHDRDHRVAPVVGWSREEHQRPAVGGHLHGAEHDALAGQLLAAGPLQRRSRPAVAPTRSASVATVYDDRVSVVERRRRTSRPAGRADPQRRSGRPADRGGAGAPGRRPARAARRRTRRAASSPAASGDGPSPDRVSVDARAQHRLGPATPPATAR